MAGPGRSNDVQDRKDRPEVRDSQLSESDRAALDYAKALRDEKQHWTWLWKKFGWVLRWPTLAGGVVITFTMIEKLAKLVRDGL